MSSEKECKNHSGRKSKGSRAMLDSPGGVEDLSEDRDVKAMENR